jgi:beta-lactamase superfamily II metal-dependent hydrolase
MLTEASLPWYRKEIPGQGNCFFQVVAMAIYEARQDDRTLQRKVRSDLADYLLTNVFGIGLEAARLRYALENANPPVLAVLDTEHSREIVSMYDSTKSERDGKELSLFDFVYQLQFDELQIEQWSINSSYPKPRYTLWGDASFVATVTFWRYQRGCQFVSTVPDDAWRPTNPNNIIFLHTAVPPHFDTLRYFSRPMIKPMVVFEKSAGTDAKVQKIEDNRTLFSKVVDNLATTHPCSLAMVDHITTDESAPSSRASDDDDYQDDSDYGLSVHFLDVGMGDGTYLICPDGTTILVDLGSTMNADIACKDAIKFIVDSLIGLKEMRGLEAPTIDRLYISHWDEDHYNQLPNLWLEVKKRNKGELKIGAVFIGGVTKNYLKKTTVFNQENDTKPRPFSEVFFGRYEATTYDPDYHEDKLSMVDSHETVGICVLSANCTRVQGKKGNPNPYSIVLLVTYASRVIVLMADAESAVEDSILEHYNIILKSEPTIFNCDVLKLGHHGAEAASSAKWLEATQPRRAVVSADMQWSHPYKSVIDRVLALNSLIADYPHDFLAGTGGNPNRAYVQVTTDKALYSTITSMEAGPSPTVKPGAKKMASKRKAVVETYVRVLGCQYQYIVYEDGMERWADTKGNISDESALGDERN